MTVSWQNGVEPYSAMRDRADFVRMSGRLSVAFNEGVAGYAEGKWRRR
ncbi:MAG: hypothetical protein SPI30_02020 [Prevotella sp.]|nr:hypothetical protein [Prevotella sp.]